MRRIAAVALLSVTASCLDVTASETTQTTVGLSQKDPNSLCVKASPDPVAVRVDQGLGFTNRSTVSLTIILAEDDVPLVNVGPSQTSGGIKFSSPGTRQYYIQGCGSASAEMHSITVTIN